VAGRGALDPGKEGLEVVRQLVLVDVELGGDHPAADVDTDGRRDHGALGGNDRTDRRPDADVSVGHEGHVTLHDRQAGRFLRLADRLGIDVTGPRQELRVDGLVHGHPLRW
jgi:hypothetical protein